jgi:hypothetical protein
MDKFLKSCHLDKFGLTKNYSLARAKNVNALGFKRLAFPKKGRFTQRMIREEEEELD